MNSKLWGGWGGGEGGWRGRIGEGGGGGGRRGGWVCIVFYSQFSSFC